MQAINLSKADAKVLAHVFDPESAPGPEILINPQLTADRNITDVTLLTELRRRESIIVSSVETFERAQPKAQSKDSVYQSAFERIGGLIDDWPSYASARNNRAQLIRWMYGDRCTVCQPRGRANAVVTTAVSTAIDDLKTAIQLAEPTHPLEAISPSQGRILAQAHTQLAALYYAAAKDLDSFDMEVTCPALQDWSKEDVDAAASKHFQQGGLYGNEVAKALAVHTNPYAKMCSGIVKEAMRKELAGT